MRTGCGRDVRFVATVISAMWLGGVAGAQPEESVGATAGAGAKANAAGEAGDRASALNGAPEAAVQTPRLLWKVPLKSNSFGGAALADVDGDGTLEIAFATYFGDSAVRLVNAEDGSPVWTWQGKEQCLDASLRFTDVNQDGVLDLVVPVSNTGLVLALDAASGKELWKYKTPDGECIDTPPAIVDTDGDGKPEVVVGTFGGNLHVIRGTDGTGVRVIKAAPGAVQSCPVVMDLNGDAVTDFVAANFKGDDRVHAIDGKTGEELWFVQTGSHIYHGPSVGDVDGDGKSDFAIGSYDGKIYCFGADGGVKWMTAPGDRYFMSPTVMIDLDKDEKDEVVCASQRVSVINGDGTIRWSVDADRSGGYDGVTRGVSVADMDGDGGADFAVLSGGGLFRAFRGKDGAVLYEFDAASVHHRAGPGSSHGPAIGDFDGDGKLDVFFVVGGDYQNRHGSAIALTGFAGSGEGWSMLRHDQLNTGNVRTELEAILRGRKH